MIDMPSEHTEGLLRIGEVARLFNLSVGTLRHYEQMGYWTRRTSIRRAGTATTDRGSSPPSIPSATCAFSICHSHKSVIL